MGHYFLDTQYDDSNELKRDSKDADFFASLLMECFFTLISVGEGG